MAKKRFQFDPVTHRFLPVERNWFTKGLQAGFIVISVLLLAVMVNFLTEHFLTHPKEKRLLAEKKAIIDQYQTCEERIGELESVIADMQARDDNVYRTYFELKPLPRSIRQAGLGGSERYSYLEGFESSPLMIGLTQRADLLDVRLNIQAGSFDDLLAEADQHARLISHKPSIQPVSLQDFYWISSVFGYRTDPMTKLRTMHKGIDFASSVGTPVYATGDGIVKSASYSSGGYGREIIIDHGFGYTTLYGHLNSILVYKGQKIKRGMVIGNIGNTGKSTGPHLHYEVRLYNRAQNPKNYYAEDLSPEEYKQIVGLPDTIDN